jgi:hypothetical protein
MELLDEAKESVQALFVLYYQQARGVRGNRAAAALLPSLGAAGFAPPPSSARPR